MNLNELVTRMRAGPLGEGLAVERATGVPYETFRRIKQGLTKNPRVETFEKLTAYYDAQDAMTRLAHAAGFQPARKQG